MQHCYCKNSGREMWAHALARRGRPAETGGNVRPGHHRHAESQTPDRCHTHLPQHFHTGALVTDAVRGVAREMATTVREQQ